MNIWSAQHFHSFPLETFGKFPPPSSAGTLGVVTEATLKVRPLPVAQRYGSLAFPDFAAGVGAAHQVVKEVCAGGRHGDVFSWRILKVKGSAKTCFVL